MASKTKKLGLAADIFSDSIDGVIRKIPLANISPDATQPRKNKDINISNLAQSLKEEGLLQPIVVNKESGNRYSIVAGERRFRAAQSLGWKEIECRIISKNGKDKFRLAVIENLQRENLDAVEEAQAFHRLKNLFNYTDNDLAKIIGKSRNYISEILSIAEISSAWLEKATQAAILSKNLLVQFALAIKIDKGIEFLNAYQNAEISTVKDAKAFVQKAKGNFPPATDKQEPETSADKKDSRATNSSAQNVLDHTPTTEQTQKPIGQDHNSAALELDNKPTENDQNSNKDNTQSREEKKVIAFHLQSQWKSEKQIDVKIEMENPHELRTFTLETLDNYLQEKLQDFLRQ